jgi:hypothetical protein
MKVLKVITILFIYINVPAQNTYKVPVSEDLNTIELEIKNETQKIIPEARIYISERPEWVKFETEEIIIKKLKSNETANVLFQFYLTTPEEYNQSSRVVFYIEKETGMKLLKQINIVPLPPVKYELQQNYPNPFNPITIIKYSIPIEGFANLSVYNALGERVTTLVNQVMKAGSYDINFNAAGIASGVYFYRIEVGDFLSVKKMMVLK